MLLTPELSVVFLAGCNADIHVIVKIESADSIPNLQSIISASDGVSISCDFIFMNSSPADPQLLVITISNGILCSFIFVGGLYRL